MKDSLVSNDQNSTGNDNENLKKLQDENIKLNVLLEEKKNEVNSKNKEIIELKQKIIDLEDERIKYLSDQNESIEKMTENIVSNFSQTLNSNLERIVQSAVEKLFLQSYNDVSQMIASKSNEIIQLINGQNDTTIIDLIKKKFNDLKKNIKTNIQDTFLHNSTQKNVEESITSFIRCELNKRKEENDSFQRGIEKLKKEKNELISCLDKELKKVEKELQSTEQLLELYKSKFDNSRLVIKNIFTNYLDQEFFQPHIEQCFLNKDLNVEEVSSLSKSIKVNLVVKMYDYILNDVIMTKIINKRGFEEIVQLVSSLDLDFNSKEDLYKFTDNIKIDDTNILNQIICVILKLYDEKCVECQLSLDKHVSNKYQIINLTKEKEDLLKALEEFKPSLPKEEEIKQTESDPQNDELNDSDPIQVLSARNDKLEKENMILQAQQSELKEQTKEVLLKVQNDLRDIENMVDRRIVSNFVIKALDRSTSKKIRITVIDTLANFLGFSNEDRKKIGLSFNSGNNPIFAPTSSEKAKELSEDILNNVMKD